jgi:hypothetical protein
LKSLFTGLALGVGLLAGYALNHLLPVRPASAQEPGKVLVQGHGRAISSRKPPGEQFTLSAENDQRLPFKVVPAGKKFVLTDVVYIAQGSVRQDLTVNLADTQPGVGTGDILFQVRISPGESHEVHFCSGYIIPSGHALAAWTNAGLEPEQYVSLSVTGYLADE